MRAATIAAGLVLVLTACGGEKKAEAPAAAATPAPEAAAPAPAPDGATAMTNASGANIDVNMVLDGTAYKYVPASVTAKAGDVIRFHNKSGGPHNVGFDAAGIPSGAAGPIDAALGAGKMGPLIGALVVEQDAVITLNTTGFPVGKYAFNCTPHQALGMKGELTVN